MMKLILSLTLIWTLSSTAEALECWTGEGVDPNQFILRPCNSAELCATVALQGYMYGDLIKDTNRLCLSSSFFSEGKHTFSFNIGFVTMAASVHVCNTDGCNNQAMPYPVLTKNELQCFTCSHPSSFVCDKTVQCVGTEDRCISGTVTYQMAQTFYTYGCASANLSEVASNLELLPANIPFKFPNAPKFCGSSFCNSAWSVKLNMIPLLFGLFTLIVY